MSNPSRDNAAAMTWESRLAAVGRVLDRRAQPARDVCLMETGDGFLVQRLVATETASGHRWIVATDELLHEQLDAEPAHAAPRGPRRWRP